MPPGNTVDIQGQQFLPLRTLASALIILLPTTIALDAAELIFVGQRDFSWTIGEHANTEAWRLRDAFTRLPA
jgi:hypothetical protein